MSHPIITISRIENLSISHSQSKREQIAAPKTSTVRIMTASTRLGLLIPNNEDTVIDLQNDVNNAIPQQLIAKKKKVQNCN